MTSTDSITRELAFYHIRSLKLFSVLAVIGSLVFSTSSIFFLSAGKEIFVVFIPYVIGVSINAQFITKMENGGKLGYIIMSWLSWGAIVGVSVLTGGVYSVFIFVFSLLLTSSYLYSRRQGLTWTSVIFLSLIILYLLNHFNLIRESIVPVNNYHYFQFYTLLYLVYLSAVLALFFNRSAEKARNSRNIIRDQNAFIKWKNYQMMDNVRYAGKIQSSLFVKTSYLESIFKEHCLFYRPKDHVGGDFYWVHKQENGKVVWAVGDCTGHGVSGALMTMIGVSLLNDIVIEQKKDDAKQVLDCLNEGFLRDLSQDKARSGMNIGVCVIDPDQSKISYAGAKIQLQIIRDKQLHNLDPVMKSIGYNYDKAKGYEFRKEDFSTQAGDVLYMFSDGYSDQFGGPKKQKFFTQNLQSLLVHNSPKSMREQEGILKRNFEDWTKTFSEQIDDVLVMGVRL